MVSNGSSSKPVIQAQWNHCREKLISLYFTWVEYFIVYLRIAIQSSVICNLHPLKSIPPRGHPNQKQLQCFDSITLTLSSFLMLYRLDGINRDKMWKMIIWMAVWQWAAMFSVNRLYNDTVVVLIVREDAKLLYCNMSHFSIFVKLYFCISIWITR